MPRAGLTHAAVVERGAELLAQRGAAGLSLAVVAESFGVRAPSLYKHIDGMPGLWRAITVRSKASLADELRSAATGLARGDALRAMATAYRRWALAHPQEYPLTIVAPVAGDPDDEQVSADLAQILYEVLAGYELTGDDAIDAVRFFRATLHGFVDLETRDAFQLERSVDESFDRLLRQVELSVERWPRSS